MGPGTGGAWGRRRVLATGGMMTGAVITGGLGTAPAHGAPKGRPSRPSTWFGHAAPFRQLQVLTDDQLSPAEAVMIGTLQGLRARGSRWPHLWVDDPGSASPLWLADLRDRHHVRTSTVDDPWQLLAGPGRPRGYIRYDLTDEPSVAVATSLAGIHGAVAVDVGIETKARAAGLRLLADARGKDDQWLLDHAWGRLHRGFAVEQKPSFGVQLRDLAVLHRAPLFYSGNTATRERLITRLAPDAPVIGWGDADHGEDAFVGPDSVAGVFQVACDWGRNLSTLSGIRTQRLRQHTPSAPAKAEHGVHHVTFVVTDGDNVQWLLTSLPKDEHWWANPHRGTVPLGWGMAPSLIDLAPSALAWYYRNASRGRDADEFVVGPSGGGYFYPSSYPADRLREHTARLDTQLARTDLGVVQILDFDALDKTSVWDAYTRREHVDGLLYLEYSRYDAGRGRIVWSRDKPVISARHMLWDGLDGADNASVTAAINAAARDPYSADGYSFVSVHAWSKTLDDVRAVVDGLDDHVRVVTPSAFTSLVARNVTR